MSGMADLIRNHWVEKWEHPTFASAVKCMAEGCDWEGQFPGDIADHNAELLTGAGYGPIWPAAALGWDAAVSAMTYEDGTPVEIAQNSNPYRQQGAGQ
jgi:hypothetical protein